MMLIGDWSLDHDHDDRDGGGDHDVIMMMMASSALRLAGASWNWSQDYKHDDRDGGCDHDDDGFLHPPRLKTVVLKVLAEILY